MKYKHAMSLTERQALSGDYIDTSSDKPYLTISEWTVNDIVSEPQWLGLTGSPTKVKKIENVVFQAKESKKLTPADAEIEELIVELIANHTIG